MDKGLQKPSRRSTIDDPMVEGQAEGQALLLNGLSPFQDEPGIDFPHSEKGGFGRIEDRRKKLDSVGAQVGHGEGASLLIFLRQFLIPGLFREMANRFAIGGD